MNNFLEVFLLFSNLVLIVFVYLLVKRSQNNQNDSDQYINQIKSINSHLDSVRDKVNDNQHQVKDIFNKSTNELKDNINNILKQMQSEVNTTIQNSLSNLQKTNTVEIDRMITFSKTSFDQIYQSNNKKLTEIQSDIELRLDKNLAQNLKSFEEVSIKLGEMTKTAEVMIRSTTSIDKLNKIFDRTASKSFGGFGEKHLENILDNHLKGLWRSQEKIKNGTETIDFVIDLGDFTLGIDSKFPLTIFNDYLECDIESKDRKRNEYLAQVKKMTSDIASKYGDHFTHVYIYLPSDSMYNEVITDSRLNDHFYKSKVVPLSPTTLLAVVMAVANINEKIILNKNAQLIHKNLGDIDSALRSFADKYRTLGDKLRLVQNNYEEGGKYVGKLENEINKIKSLEQKSSQELLENHIISDVIINDNITLEIKSL